MPVVLYLKPVRSAEAAQEALGRRVGVPHHEGWCHVPHSQLFWPVTV